jgi:hypothetical protein
VFGVDFVTMLTLLLQVPQCSVDPVSDHLQILIQLAASDAVLKSC